MYQFSNHFSCIGFSCIGFFFCVDSEFYYLKISIKTLMNSEHGFILLKWGYTHTIVTSFYVGSFFHFRRGSFNKLLGTRSVCISHVLSVLVFLMGEWTGVSRATWEDQKQSGTLLITVLSKCDPHQRVSKTPCLFSLFFLCQHFLPSLAML